MKKVARSKNCVRDTIVHWKIVSQDMIFRRAEGLEQPVFAEKSCSMGTIPSWYCFPPCRPPFWKLCFGVSRPQPPLRGDLCAFCALFGSKVARSENRVPEHDFSMRNRVLHTIFTAGAVRTGTRSENGVQATISHQKIVFTNFFLVWEFFSSKITLS